MSTKLRMKAIVLLVAGVLALTLAGGCTLDVFKPPTTATPPAAADGLDSGLLQEAYDIIRDEYVEPGRLDATDLSRGAIKGMVQGMDDPYSAYLDPEQYKLTVGDFEGQFDGIGAFVGLQNGAITIIAPIPDTPAAKAGIKAGDIVLAINGESTADMTVQDAVLLIRGPRGTTVSVTVLHEGGTEPETLEITRAEIRVPSVRFEMKGDYAWLNITNFSERTDAELQPALKTITDNKAKGIILDLRQNPGGILNTVVEDASHFLREGVVVHVVDRDGNKETHPVNRFATKIDLPMVVLVDRFSASGSEVLAGALQDYKRAIIAGEKTFGKGSVNTLIRLSDGSGIYITIARWQTPNGNLIEGEGIQPDIAVDWDTVDGIQWGIDYLNSIVK